MAPKAELIVRLMETPICSDKLSLVVSFKARARSDIENAISAIAILGGVAPALHLHIVDILRIELRAHIARNVCIRNGHAVDQPEIPCPPRTCSRLCVI